MLGSCQFDLIVMILSENGWPWFSKPLERVIDNFCDLDKVDELVVLESGIAKCGLFETDILSLEVKMGSESLEGSSSPQFVSSPLSAISHSTSS